MQTVERIRKSESLFPDEFKAFKKWVASMPTKIDCAEALEVTRATLDRLLLSGSAKPYIIEKIREAIK